jgi:hypothetical protein
MRFYTGAHDYLHKAGKMSDAFDQCLYLVPEQSNKYDSNAVMLHNGKQKLGSVEANDAAKVRHLLDKWKNENCGGIAGEDVIVVKCDPMYIDPQTFAFKGSIKVRGMYRVNERLARKFSNKHRKEV